MGTSADSWSTEAQNWQVQQLTSEPTFSIQNLDLVILKGDPEQKAKGPSTPLNYIFSKQLSSRKGKQEGERQGTAFL